MEGGDQFFMHACQSSYFLQIEIEGLRYLPEAYKVLLRGSKSKGSDENLQDLERELSQPPESPSGSPEPPSYRPDEKEQLEYFSRNFPIDDSVDDPVENAKRAKAAVEEYNFPRQLDQARNSVALKFQEDAFKYLGNLITKEKVEERDRVFGAGSVLFNDEPSDMCAGHQTAAIILTWMHKRRVPVDLDTEAAAEKEVGGLLNKIIIGEVIEVGKWVHVFLISLDPYTLFQWFPAENADKYVRGSLEPASRRILKGESGHLAPTKTFFSCFIRGRMQAARDPHSQDTSTIGLCS